MSASDAVTAVKVVGQAAGVMIGVLSWNKARVEEKKRIWADVYRALSRHPILKHTYPNYPDPSSKWDSLDFYRQLVTQSKKHEIFTEASKLGETGAKAKVVLVLLWIIVQHLPKGMEVEGVISRAITIEADTYGEPLTTVTHFPEVIGELAKLFRTPLPSEILDSLDRLTPSRIGDRIGDSSRFYVEFLKGFHKTPLPSSCHHHEYDLSKKPHALLETHAGFVMAPKNEKTERVMAWCIYKLRLGKHFKPSSSGKGIDGPAWLAILPPIKRLKARKPQRRPSNKTPARDTLRKPRRKSTGPSQTQVVYRIRGRISPRSPPTSKELPKLASPFTDSVPLLEDAPSIHSEPDARTLKSGEDVLPPEDESTAHGRKDIPDLRQLLQVDAISNSLDVRLAVAHSILPFHPALDHTLLRFPVWANIVLPLFGVPEATVSHRRLKIMIALLWTVGIFLSEDQFTSLISSVFEDCIRRIQKLIAESRDSHTDLGSHSESDFLTFDALLSLEEVIKGLANIVSNSRSNTALTDESLADENRLPVDIESFLRSYTHGVAVDDTSEDLGINKDIDLRLRQAISDVFGVSEEPNDEDEDEDEEEADSTTLHHISVDIQTNPTCLFRNHRNGAILVPSNDITRSVMKTLVEDFTLEIRAGELVNSGEKATSVWIADLEDELDNSKLTSSGSIDYLQSYLSGP